MMSEQNRNSSGFTNIFWKKRNACQEYTFQPRFFIIAERSFSSCYGQFPLSLPSGIVFWDSLFETFDSDQIENLEQRSYLCWGSMTESINFDIPKHDSGKVGHLHACAVFRIQSSFLHSCEGRKLPSDEQLVPRWFQTDLHGSAVQFHQVPAQLHLVLEQVNQLILQLVQFWLVFSASHAHHFRCWEEQGIQHKASIEIHYPLQGTCSSKEIWTSSNTYCRNCGQKLMRTEKRMWKIKEQRQNTRDATEMLRKLCL